MSLSKLEGDAALDALADLIEPATVVMGDPEMRGLIKSGQKMAAIRYSLKNHKKEITTILAILDGENPDTYKPRLLTAPIKLMEVLNDPEIQTLFFSPEKTPIISGSVTESIGVARE